MKSMARSKCPRLEGRNSKRMQAVGMVGIDGKDLAVAKLGFD